MEAIENLTNINILVWILGLFTILFSAKEVIEIFTYFKNKFRIKTGIEEDKETIEDRIALLEKHDKWQYNELSKISKYMEDLNNNFLEKEISDIRWELLDFCSALTGGRRYNREAFEHIFRTYERYEEILKEHNMTNGFVEESMNAVRDIYHERLLNNSF